MRKLFLALAYNGLWAAAVFGGAAGTIWPGVATAVLLIGIAAVMRGGVDRCWLFLLFAAGLYGTTVDGALHQAGLLMFPATPDAFPLPAWMPALWVGFAAIIAPVFGFLRERLLLAAFLGAVAGPVTYSGAARFDAAVFADGLLPIALVALEWALFMPLAVIAAWRIEDARIARQNVPAPPSQVGPGPAIPHRAQAALGIQHRPSRHASSSCRRA